MKCTTKGTPTAGYHCRLRPAWRQESEQHSAPHPHQENPSNERGEDPCDEHGRVLAILAMGSDGVPPLLVRRAVDEQWTIEQAARAFGRMRKPATSGQRIA